MNRQLFRKAIQWFGLLALVHAAAMLVYIVFFANSVAAMLADNYGRAVMTVLNFNAVFDILVLCYRAKVDTSYVDYRKSMRDDLKAGTFNIKKYFVIREHLINIGVFAAFQIPFMIFFAVVKDFLYYPLLFSRFYMMDAGFYLATNSALLGLLLNTLLFGAIYTLVKLLFILRTKKQMAEDICN